MEQQRSSVGREAPPFPSPVAAGGGGGDGSSASSPPDTLVIGGIRIAQVDRRDLRARMLADTAAAREGTLPRPRVITSANGSVIADYHRSARFRALVDAADMVDADGMPLVFASRLFCKRPLTERTATTDFLLDAADAAARADIRFYFLGGRPGVAVRAAEHLRSRFPGLKVVGARHGYFGPEETDAICARIRALKVDVLWVGLGSPAQERFAIEWRERLAGVAWIRTCGGLFDHYGGGVSRAPGWMQAVGLEWMYRAAREPLRLGWRYLVTNPMAIFYLATRTHD